MSPTNVSKKINLVTLLGQDKEPLSFAKALGALARLLMEAPLQELVQTLAEIGSVLYDKSSEAESYLRERFYSKQTIKAICPLDDENTVNYLFPYNALYILNTLLTFNIKLTAEEMYVQIFHVSGEDTSFAGNQQSTTLPIAEIFLLANQLILYLEKDLSGVAFYYSRTRCQEEVFTALSKAKNLYGVPYFNEQFMRRLGYTIIQWESYQFMLLTAVKVAKPAKIELDVSFNKVKDEADRSRVNDLAKMLTLEAKGINATLDEVTRVLWDDFILDNRCRGKPFLKVDQRYICIRHDLLISSTGNFPYHYLFSVMTEDEKEILLKEFGNVFEKRYIPMISAKALDQRIESYTYKRKPYRGNQLEDLCVSVMDQAKLILEIKSGRANDAVKRGLKKALIEKYIHLKSSSGKPKGIIQALKQADKLRNDGFSGEIFTGIVFYDLPSDDEFDQLIAQEIESTKEYKEYRSHQLNYSPIWMDVLAYELLLIAVQQGVNLHDILKKLSALPPSETSRAIANFMLNAGLKTSIHGLYAEEIKRLQEDCKAMLLPESETNL
ncbi:MAG: hypothetical protein ABSA17_00390 [Rhabdochlamydiaceae bacterium]|jgi:hypothetical protein